MSEAVIMHKGKGEGTFNRYSRTSLTKDAEIGNKTRNGIR
ncbi:hypothetical protein B188_19100 [Candidatus Brocadiaceae bacterium B188]|jgi:hypothetical protein|nr:hypothetical protein B188_19100 [Candidatus Brocadiaceae bacterium B188]